MDLIAGYGSGAESAGESSPSSEAPPTYTLEKKVVEKPRSFRKAIINTAPSVKTVDLTPKDFQASSSKEVMYNMSYEVMWAPVAGPVSHLQRGSSGITKNTPTGYAEETAVNHAMFNAQYNQFNGRGTAEGPSDWGGVVTENRRGEGKGVQVQRGKKRKMGDPSDVEGYAGPWAAQEGLEESKAEPIKMTAHHYAYLEGRKRTKREEHTLEAESTIFHGKEEKDYMGRTFMDPPPGQKFSEHNCYIPKKLIHTYQGHSAGVACIRWFPNTAHLLLSGSMDTKLKIWDVYNNRAVKRTYLGHERAIKDIDFNCDGTRFLSAGYDKITRLWDTETGKCLGRYSNKHLPHVVKFHPDPDKCHEFLVGGSDSKIIQWDITSGEQTLEYNEHLGPVNTITFYDENRRFLTTSDDKSIRLWEYGLPVQIKVIREPHMHSMPNVEKTLDDAWIGTQSLDNQIIMWHGGERFRMHKKKRFAGHINSGYACQMAFSADNKFVCSGDASGKVFFWDWKTTKILKTLKAHSQVCIGTLWHPIEPSRLATCSWDGTIKLWD